MVDLEQLSSEAMAVIQNDSMLAEWFQLRMESSWANFIPRPDNVANFDQQASFCHNLDPVSFMVGGNAAGTTEAAAYKTAQFLLRQQPPPRKNTPFWVISNTYDQVCGVCWDEKLYGHGHIPECEVQWDQVGWLDKKQGYPRSVPLKPWPGEPHKNWKLEFKSYEQGRRALQARSIGGFWFSEQFPLDLFLETLRGCRDCMFPGGQFAEFTPIDPELCIWVETVMENPPEGWRFYRANTECNKANLAPGWYEQFFATVPDELVATRQTGELASFEGVIYQSFSRAVHTFDGKIDFPPACTHVMGTDWGASEEHAHCTIFAYMDGMGSWTIYDEYYSVDQSKITADHVAEIQGKCKAWGWPEQIIRQRDANGNGNGNQRISDQHLYYRGNFADPSRPGEINEFSRRGIPTSGASNAVYEGINAVRSLLKCHPVTGEPGLRIHERCKMTIEQMRKYRWKKGRRPTAGTFLNPQVAAPVPLKRDDDCCDALRYAIYTLLKHSGLVISSMKTHDPIERRKSIQMQKLDAASSAMLRAGHGKAGGWFKPGG